MARPGSNEGLMPAQIYKQIEEDGFNIDRKVDIKIDEGDGPQNACNAVGLGTSGFAEAFLSLRPDYVVLLGDRFEILAAATAAYLCNLAVVHIHGGEVTEGAFDDGIRHAITKMSHLHFVSHDEYRKRVIQLGEHPDRVLTVGALGVEAIASLDLMSKEEFEKSINFTLQPKNLLITYHPVTTEYGQSEEHMQALLSALASLDDTGFIFTLPNADPDNRVITELIKDFQVKYPEVTTVHTSLGQLRYLSALRYVDGVVGNSSSGILEAPSFKIGTLNIGSRQTGRIKANSVIDCDVEVEAISKSLEQLLSKEFSDTIQSTSNPYQGKNPSLQILEKLISTSPKQLLSKSFFDLT